jgi:hypothetical protein
MANNPMLTPNPTPPAAHTKKSALRPATSPATSPIAKLGSLRALCVKAAALAFLLLLTPHAHPQGCAQCLDTTQATPPAVQAAYRHAILLLAGSASSLFIAATLLLRRNR